MTTTFKLRGKQGWLAGIGLAGVAIGSLFLASCRPDLNQRGSRISLGTTAKIRTLDPADAYEMLSGTVLYNLGDRLYTNWPGQTAIAPQLATALPQISPDGLTYRIPLRQGVVFHDGAPFNAAAMAFSLNRFKDSGGQPAFLLKDRVASITATAPYELTIRLKQPFAPFTALLTFPGLVAVSPKAYAPKAGGDRFFPDRFIGTGPYQLAGRTADTLRLTPFARYWGRKPANSGIDIQIFSSPAILFNAIKTGMVDVAYQSLDTDQIRALQQATERRRLHMATSDGTGIYYLSVNVRSAPLDRLAVRQALAYLVDRQLINQRVFANQRLPLYSLLPTELPSFVPAFYQRYGHGNPQRARHLLTTEGYSAQRPLKLQLWYRSNLETNALAASTLRAHIHQQMGPLVQLELRGIDSTTAYQNLDKGAYPLFMLDWTPDFLDADNYLQPFLACTKGSLAQGCEVGASQYQGSFFYSPQANRLLALQGAESNPQRRSIYLRKLQQLTAQEVPFLPLWQSREYVFSGADISGLNLQPTNQVAFAPLRRTSRVAR
jgi:peptide/nickel transport system substrate-binding protein